MARTICDHPPMSLARRGGGEADRFPRSLAPCAPHGVCLAPAQAPSSTLSAQRYICRRVCRCRHRCFASIYHERCSGGVAARLTGFPAASRLAPPHSVCLAPAQAPSSTLSAQVSSGRARPDPRPSYWGAESSRFTTRSDASASPDPIVSSPATMVSKSWMARLV